MQSLHCFISLRAIIKAIINITNGDLCISAHPLDCHGQGSGTRGEVHSLSEQILLHFDSHTGGARDMVTAESSGGASRATGGLVSNLPYPRVNKTKQHTARH